MKETGIVRRFDPLGRIVIPMEIRKRLFPDDGSEGKPMEIFIEGSDIILRKYEVVEESDEVCDWKWIQVDIHKWTAMPQCKGDTILFDNYRLFNYCPYCGKKIKLN